VKRPGREPDHSSPSRAEVKNAWSYTSNPQYAFMAWCLVKHRHNFTFTFIIHDSSDNFIGNSFGNGVLNCDWYSQDTLTRAWNGAHLTFAYPVLDTVYEFIYLFIYLRLQYFLCIMHDRMKLDKDRVGNNIPTSPRATFCRSLI
jgi:hypothetical protein